MIHAHGFMIINLLLLIFILISLFLTNWYNIKSSFLMTWEFKSYRPFIIFQILLIVLIEIIIYFK